jgi:hypothetical protein
VAMVAEIEHNGGTQLRATGKLRRTGANEELQYPKTESPGGRLAASCRVRKPITKPKSFDEATLNFLAKFASRFPQSHTMPPSRQQLSVAAQQQQQQQQQQ